MSQGMILSLEGQWEGGVIITLMDRAFSVFWEEKKFHVWFCHAMPSCSNLGNRATNKVSRET